ncbi:MAG: hypothetical protein M2R45_03707 [Verrucomicrobia subdivision 3 bacterium]|nr:hypothetical protein [Limisphaerales bacterium]MCS1414990.1 hypothetical protein [Limisphaerales bacterium]
MALEALHPRILGNLATAFQTAFVPSGKVSALIEQWRSTSVSLRKKPTKCTPPCHETRRIKSAENPCYKF